jgi:phospholipase/lecithinase/hemolysin
MMRLIKGLLMVFLVSISLTGSASIVVFGDSLSDTGLIYSATAHTVPASPPYYQGRFSNGPVWTEYLAKNLNDKNLINYAVGGASTNGIQQHFVNLSVQVALYVTNHVFDDSKEWGEPLYILWSGPNDYWTEKGDANKAAKDVVDTILANVQMLIDYGGRKFFLPNLPDLSISPYAKKYADRPAQFRKIAVAHNAYLAKGIVDLQKRNPQAKIQLFDVSELMNVAQFYYPNLFANMTDPCYTGEWDGGGEVVGPKLMARKSATPFEETSAYQELNSVAQALVRDSVPLSIAAQVGEQARREHAMTAQKTGMLMIPSDVQYKCTGYFFWDEVHPTTQVHELLGMFATQALQK